MADKLLLESGVHWDRDNTSAFNKISGDGLSLTHDFGGNTYCIGRSSTSKASGKSYAELTITTFTGAFTVGIDDGTGSLATFVGADAKAIGWHYGGTVYTNGASIATIGTFGSTSNLGVLWDHANQKAYFRLNGVWQNSADPVAGTGGLSINTAISQAFLAVAIQNVGDVVTANFGASAFAYAIPTGATAWDTTGAAVDAWLQESGVHWDRDNTHSDVTLSSDGLTCTHSLVNNVDRMARASLARGGATGYYYEVTVSLTGAQNTIAGFDDGTTALNGFVGVNGNGIGWQQNGGVITNGGSVATWATFTTGDVLGLLWRNGKFYGRKNGGAWQGSADPVAQTGGVTPTNSPTTVYPAVDATQVPDGFTANFGATTFGTAVPSGSLAWNDSVAAGGYILLDGNLYASLGSELVSNGDFATDTVWGKGSGVTISGGKANATAASGIVSQTIGMAQGARYRVTFTYNTTTNNGGFLRINQIANSSNAWAVSPTLIADGVDHTLTFDVLTIDNAGLLAIEAHGLVYTGTIDNVSVKPWLANSVFWDRDNSQSSMALSSDGLTATKTFLCLTSSTAWTSARAVLAQSAAYFEAVPTIGGSGSIMIGVDAGTASLVDWVGDSPTGVGYWMNGQVMNNGVTSTTYATYTTGDVIGVCIKAGKVYFSKNGVWQGSSNPSTGTGGITPSGTITTAYPQCSVDGTIGSSVAARFTAASQTYAVPTGTTAWDIGSSVGLTVASAVSLSQADNVTLSPKTALTTADGVSLSQASAITLGTTLAPISAVSASQAGAVTLSPKTALTVAGGISLTQADSVVDVGHNVLTTASAVSSGQADNVALSPKTTLTVGPANSAGQADNILLAPKTSLILASAVSAGQADNVVLSPKTTISIASAVSSGQADNVSLAPKTSLILASAVSAGQADNITLSPKTSLSPASAVSLTFTTSPTLPSAYALAVFGAVSASLADNITLALNGALGVSMAVSLTTADNVVLLPKWTVTVASAVSLTQADNVLTALRWILNPDNAISLSQADAVTLAPKTSLAPASAISLTQAGNVVLANINYQLLAANAISLTQADNVTIGSHYALTAQSAVSLSQADAVTLLAKTALITADATSLTQTTSPTLLPKTSLLTNSAVSLSQTSNATLGTNGTLGTADAISISIANNVSLASNYGIAVANAVSLTQADPITLVSRYALTTANAISLSQADAVALLPKTSLVLADAVSVSVTSSPLLNLRYSLPVLNAVSLTQTSGIALLPKTSLITDNLVSLSQLSSPIPVYQDIFFGPYVITVRDQRGVTAKVGPFHITG